MDEWFLFLIRLITELQTQLKHEKKVRDNLKIQQHIVEEKQYEESLQTYKAEVKSLVSNTFFF